MIQYQFPNNVILYFVIVDPDGLIWNNASGESGFQAIDSTEWIDYAIYMTGQENTGIFFGVIPSSVPSGQYKIMIRAQQGGSPDIADGVASGGIINYTWVNSSLVESTGVLGCFDQFGAPAQGVVVECQLVSMPAGDTGNAVSTAIRAQVSDSSGAVSFSGLFQGATYNFRANGGDWVACLIPAASSFSLNDLVGQW